jgi:hypothetical protein
MTLIIDFSSRSKNDDIVDRSKIAFVRFLPRNQPAIFLSFLFMNYVLALDPLGLASLSVAASVWVCRGGDGNTHHQTASNNSVVDLGRQIVSGKRVFTVRKS